MTDDGGHGTSHLLWPQAMRNLGVVPRDLYEEKRQTARAAIRAALRHGASSAEIESELEKVREEELHG